MQNALMASPLLARPLAGARPGAVVLSRSRVARVALRAVRAVTLPRVVLRAPRRAASRRAATPLLLRGLRQLRAAGEDEAAAVAEALPTAAATCVCARWPCSARLPPLHTRTHAPPALPHARSEPAAPDEAAAEAAAPEKPVAATPEPAAPAPPSTPPPQPTAASADALQALPGAPAPLGPRPSGDNAVNFALFSKNATSVTLCMCARAHARARPCRARTAQFVALAHVSASAPRTRRAAALRCARCARTRACAARDAHGRSGCLAPRARTRSHLDALPAVR
jgi:hypothetical protein